VVVFFTYGVSLKIWHDTGLFDRELLLYKKYAEDGYRITLFTYGGKEDLEFNNLLGDINVVPAYVKLKRHKNRILRFLFSFVFPIIFRDLFRSADVFKTNQMYGSWVPVIGKLLYKKKLVVRCGHELLRNSLRDSVYSVSGLMRVFFNFVVEITTYRFADNIIMASETDIRFVNRMLHVPLPKMRLIRNFIDTENFSPNHDGNYEYTGDNSLLYVGRLIKSKNLQSLLHALKDLNIKLDIIGEGDQKYELVDIIRKLGISVDLLGIFPNSRLPSLINKYSFYILPSLYECSPKTLLEAMACGRVVIGANVEGIKELISDGKTGFLSDPDVDSINRAIKKAINLSVGERRKIGMSAREFIVNECSIEKIYRKEKDIYDQIVTH